MKSLSLDVTMRNGRVSFFEFRMNHFIYFPERSLSRLDDCNSNTQNRLACASDRSGLILHEEQYMSQCTELNKGTERQRRSHLSRCHSRGLLISLTDSRLIRGSKLFSSFFKRETPSDSGTLAGQCSEIYTHLRSET